MEHINLEFFYNLERGGKHSVIEFCIKVGFIASSYECPECKNPMRLIHRKDRNQDAFFWQCRHEKNITRSIRKGSWFQESQLSLITMLKLAYLWVKKTSNAWIIHELKIATHTVCDLMAFFRRVCVNAIQREGIFIGGPDEIVEIDAKSFSNIKNKQGQETWVFGGVERSAKKCFLEVIQSGEENEIISILQKYVHPGTTIVSDHWKGFDCLESNGYVHQKTSGLKDKNNVLCLWGRVKKIVSQRISNNQFDAHLAEVMWRRLQKEDTQGLLISFFKILCQMCPPQKRDDATYISIKTEIEKEDHAKTQLMKMNENNNEEQGETQLMKMNENNNEEQGDHLEGENESQNKRQKTMDSLDT